MRSAALGGQRRRAGALRRAEAADDISSGAKKKMIRVCQNDPRVPRSESDSIVKALRARGVPVEYMVAANEGHSVDHRETKIELLTRVARFLTDALH